MDINRAIGRERKPHPVISDSQPQFPGLTLQGFYVAFASFGKPQECGKDAHGCSSIQATDVQACRFRPEDDRHRQRFRLAALLDRRLNSATTFSWGIPRPARWLNHSFDSATERRSDSVSGSSSTGAFATARETGSRSASSIPTTAETWLGAKRSINSWACCFPLEELTGMERLSSFTSFTSVFVAYHMNGWARVEAEGQLLLRSATASITSGQEIRDRGYPCAHLRP